MNLININFFFNNKIEKKLFKYYISNISNGEKYEKY